MRSPADEPRIESVGVSAFTIPTDGPEADGTFAWSETTLVLVEASGGGRSGLGFTYGDRAVAPLVRERLAPLLLGQSPFALPLLWERMRAALRNAGRPGAGSLAISAVDLALWDLKARLLELPLFRLLGRAREEVPVYGSGGFTSQSPERLREQLAGWAAGGISRVKMKIGADSADALERARAAREAVGPDAALFVDANGAFDRKQALEVAARLGELGVTWFEEPVSSDDLDGLRQLRDRAPAGMDIAAGEYGFDLDDFRRLLQAGAVDVLQADVTRCQGVTGFLRVAALCEAFHVPLSAHTAPAMHLHACLAAPRLRHLEYFHDHVRIERMLFDGAVEPVGGALRADASRPGHGLTLRRADAERFAR